jgi:hypothetical protein
MAGFAARKSVREYTIYTIYLNKPRVFRINFDFVNILLKMIDGIFLCTGKNNCNINGFTNLPYGKSIITNNEKS